MDWLTEFIKTSPVLATIIVVIWFLFSYQRTQNGKMEAVFQRYLEKFNKQQQEIEQQFRMYLINDSQENRRVIEEYTKVIQAFNETVSKTNIILEQNIDINRRLLIQTEKHK